MFSLPEMLLTPITRFDQHRSVLHHSLYDLTDGFKIFLGRFAELVHIEVVTRERKFLRGLAGVETA